MDTGNVDLLQWNDLIAEEILKTAQFGKPLYLYLDEQLLSKASGIENKYDARDSFMAAYVSYNDGDIRYCESDPFKHAYALWCKYRNNPENFDYPFLAGIFVTILAVTADSPDGIGELAVYAKLRWLLGYHEDQLGLGILPGYANQVKKLYEQWNQFLQTPDGEVFGLPTASPGRLIHQGWAWSQCLLRPKDRWKILEWVDEEQVDTTDTESIEFLAHAFLKWLRRMPLEDRKLLRLVFNEDGTINSSYFEVFLKIFEDELTTTVDWDISEKISRTGLISIADAFEPTITLAFKIDETVENREIQYHGESIKLLSSMSPVRFHTTDLPKDFLSNGCTIDLDSMEVRFFPKKAYVLEENPTDDSFIQTNKTYLHQEYVVLTPLRYKDAVLDDFKAAGVTDFREMEFIQGWRIFQEVVFTEVVEDHENAILPLPKESISPLLVGGLEIAPSTYLSGGEPILLVPDRFLDSISINGNQLESNLTGDTINLSAKGVAKLKLGLNVIQVKSKKFAIEISDGIVTTPEFEFDGVPIGNVDVIGDKSQENAQGIQKISGNNLTSYSSEQTWLTNIFPTSNTEDMYAVTLSEGIYKLNHFPQFCKEIGALPRWGSWDYLHKKIPRDTKWLLLGNTGNARLAGSLKVIEVPENVRPNEANPKHIRVTNRELLNRVLRAIPQAEPAMKKIEETIVREIENLTRLPIAVTPRSIPPAPIFGLNLTTEYPQQSNLDLILEWLSEIPSGKVTAEAFKKAWDHLVRTSNNAEKMTSHIALFNLKQLGHVEVLNDSHHIQITRPHVHLLSGVGDHLVLSGARPRRLINDLNDPSRGEFTDLQDLEIQFLKGPEGITSLYFTIDPDDQQKILETFKAAGIQWAGDFRKEFSRKLVSFHEKIARSPIIDSKLDGLELKMRDRKSADSGIYIFEPHMGMQIYFYKTPAGKLFQVTPALAYSAFRFFSETTELHAAWERQSETLTLFGSLKLGDFAFKWLCSHSGLLPIYDPTNNSRTYLNIPFRSLEKLADSYKLNWKMK